jgi:hypothetical protein
MCVSYEIINETEDICIFANMQVLRSTNKGKNKKTGKTKN